MTTKTKKAIGTKFFKEGTQNQKILQKYWGTGKTFTAFDLVIQWAVWRQPLLGLSLRRYSTS